MNRIYRLVWSRSREKWMAVSEKAAAGWFRRQLTTAVFATSLLLSGGSAWALDTNALPTGGEIAAGSGSIAQSGSSMTVNQTTDKMVAEWGSFNIGKDASVIFNQPNASSIALNRISDQNASQILGSLTANGQVFLLNPSGVIFGSTARVDVGGLVASTLDLSNEDFLSGNYTFTGSSGSIINNGTINTAEGGYVAFIAPSVKNNGAITADNGAVVMAAGNKVSLDFTGDNLVTFTVDEGVVEALAENSGLIKADNGMVYMTAKAAGSLIQSGVNNTGVIEAKGLTEDGGRIVLYADGGQTTVSGDLDVSSDGANGGSVITTGDYVIIESGAHLNASGATGGGEVLVGGSWQGSDNSIHEATGTLVETGALLEANATVKGNGGTVVAWSDVDNEDSVTGAYGAFEANGGVNGGDGGRIETSGHWLDITGVSGSASAVKGDAGVWLLDPYNVTISSTGTTSLSSGTWAATSSGSSILDTSIESLLEGGTSVTITTGASGSGTENGDITVSSAITKDTGDTDVTLTLQAAKTIELDAAIENKGGSGKLNIVLDADNDAGTADGAGIIILNSDISTGGGELSFGTGRTYTINSVSTLVGGDIYVAGTGARTLSTEGGDVNIRGEMIVANTDGLTINSSGGDVHFYGLLNSGNTYTSVYNSTAITWAAALDAADANDTDGDGSDVGDSYLATITSRLENAVAGRTVNYNESWLGARRVTGIGTDALWRWVTGPEGQEDGGNGLAFFTQSSSSGGSSYNGGYSNWNSGEPNNYTGSTTGTDLSADNESVLQFVGNYGKWNDYSAGAGLVSANTLNYYVKETNLANSPVTINAGIGTVIFDGEVGGNKALASLTVTAATTVINRGGVTTDGSAGQSYSGDITLGSAETVLTMLNSSADFTLASGKKITNTYGSDAILSIYTTDDIILSGDSSISSSSGELDVLLSSGTDTTHGTVNIAGTSSIDTNGGDLTVKSSYTGTDQPVVIAGTADSGAGDIDVIGNTLTLTGTLSGTGSLTIETYTASTTIGVAGGTGTLSLPSSYFLSNISNGFSSIIIGNATAGTITVGNTALSYYDPLTLKSGRSIFFSASSTLTGNGNDLVLWARAAGDDEADDDILGAVWLPEGSSISTEGGDVIIGGGTDPSIGYALGDDGSTSSENNARYRGVTVNGIIDAGGGDITINGRGNTPSVTLGARGVSIGGTVCTNGSGTITMSGIAYLTSDGLAVGDSTSEISNHTGIISAENGDITLTGTKGTGSNGINISTSGSKIVSTGTGDITLTAAAGNITENSGKGYIVSGGTTSLTASSGNISLTNTLNDFTGLVTASGSAISIVDADDMTLGTVTATDDVDISTLTGDLTLKGLVSTTDTDSTAITLNSGENASAGTSTGGSIIVNGGSVSTGSGGRAILYTGSVSASTGFTTLIGSGTGNFRYYSDESTTNYTTALGTSGVYAVYRERPTVTITMNDDSKTYNAVAYFNGNGVTFSGLVNDDTSSIIGGTLVYGGTSQVAVNAGTYTITGSGYSNGLGYALEYKNGTLTVNPKALTITGTTASDKTYDGTTAATINIGTLSGLVGTETVDVTAMGAFDSKNAGTRTAMAEYTLADGTNRGLASNYTLADTTGLTATISPKTLTVTGTTASDKTYDGTTAATINIGTLSGLVGTETVDVTAMGAFDSKNAGTRTTTAIYTLADGTNGGIADNYTLADTTHSAIITPKGLNMTGTTASDKTYDGTTAATINIGKLSGLVGTETVDVSAMGAFDSKNAGTRTTTAIYTLADGTNGGIADNYTLADTTGLTATVTPASLTLSTSAVTKTYDGTTSAAGTAIITSGILYGTDSITGGTFAYADKNAGTGKTVTVSGVTVSDGNSGGNYNVTYADNTSSTINRTSLTITADDDSKFYDGLAYSGGNGVSCSGFVTDEDEGDLDGTLSYEGASQGAVDVGFYSITPSGLASDNYLITFVDGVLNIKYSSTGVSETVESNLVSTQTGENGTGQSQNVNSNSLQTAMYVGPGTGSSTLASYGNYGIVDQSIQTTGSIVLSSSSSVSTVSLDQTGGTSILTVGAGGQTDALVDVGTLTVFSKEDNGSIEPQGSYILKEGGASIALTETASVQNLSLDETGIDTAQTVSFTMTLTDGTTIVMTAAVTENGVLVISGSDKIQDLDVDQAVLMSMEVARENLKVDIKRLKSVLLNTEKDKKADIRVGI